MLRMPNKLPKIPGVYLRVKATENGATHAVVWMWGDVRSLILLSFCGFLHVFSGYLIVLHICGGDPYHVENERGFPLLVVFFFAMTVPVWVLAQRLLPVLFWKTSEGDIWVLRVLSLPKKIKKDEKSSWFVRREAGEYRVRAKEQPWIQSKAYLFFPSNQVRWPSFGLFSIRIAGTSDEIPRSEIFGILNAIGPPLGITSISQSE